MSKVQNAIEIHILVSKGKIICGKDRLYSEVVGEIYVITKIEMHYKDPVVWVKSSYDEEQYYWGSSFRNMKFSIMDRSGITVIPFEDPP